MALVNSGAPQVDVFALALHVLAAAVALGAAGASNVVPVALGICANRPRLVHAVPRVVAEVAARSGALVVALALPAVRRALGAAGASKVVPVALGICGRTPPRLVHAVSRVVAEVAARSGARVVALTLPAVRGAQLAVALVCSVLHRDSDGGCRGGVHRERKDEAKHGHGRVGSCRGTGWHTL